MAHLLAPLVETVTVDGKIVFLGVLAILMLAPPLTDCAHLAHALGRKLRGQD